LALLVRNILVKLIYLDGRLREAYMAIRTLTFKKKEIAWL